MSSTVHHQLSHASVGMCKSNFLLFEYFVEYLIEYPLIPEVVVNYWMVQNRRKSGFSFKKFPIKNALKRVQIMP